MTTNTAPWPRWYQPPVPPKGKRGKELVASVAKDFGLSLDDMRGAGRSAHLCHARSVVVRVMRGRGLSYPAIGSFLGGRDHSTIINANRKFDAYSQADPQVEHSYRRHAVQVL